MTEDEKANAVLELLTANPCPRCAKPMRRVTFWGAEKETHQPFWYCLGCPKRGYPDPHWAWPL